MNTTIYSDEAKEDAKDCARYFMDEIIESFMDNDGKASDDLNNDYSGGDSYHHENHVDKCYDLMEAATLLDQLSDYEETDSGLWQGLEPRRAIEAQAAYTYGNAVYSYWRDLIESINDDSELEDLWEEHENVEDVVQEEYEAAKAADSETELFDMDDETERRQKEIAKKIKKRIEEVVDEF